MSERVRLCCIAICSAVNVPVTMRTGIISGIQAVGCVAQTSAISRPGMDFGGCSSSAMKSNYGADVVVSGAPLYESPFIKGGNPADHVWACIVFWCALPAQGCYSKRPSNWRRHFHTNRGEMLLSDRPQDRDSLRGPKIKGPVFNVGGAAVR